MKKYVKDFFLRGLVFGGFGPVVLGIVYGVLEYTVKDFTVTGCHVCLGVISTYILAFVHAGVSVFNQIEHWSMAKSLVCHSLTLYSAYVICYLVNSWIPFEPTVLIIFTVIFALIYLIVLVTVVVVMKIIGNKLNSKLK